MVRMEMLQIVGIGVVAAVLAVILKNQRPEMALQISIAAGVIIFLLIAGKLTAVLDILREYTKKVNLDPVFLTTLLKIAGIAYIAEFGAEVCRDAGETSIASKIELAGKVAVMMLAVPIVTSLLDVIIKIMP